MALFVPIPFFLDKICVMRYNSASVYCTFKEIAVSVQAKQKSTMNWLLKQIINISYRNSDKLIKVYLMALGGKQYQKN